MKLFLDTEFNGHGGELLSLALVPEGISSGVNPSFYVTIKPSEAIVPWVMMNVMPKINDIPEGMQVIGNRDLSREDAARALSAYLRRFENPLICADWPQDFAELFTLLIFGPGRMVATPAFRTQYESCHGFNTADFSSIPHNALADAVALKDYWLDTF